MKSLIQFIKEAQSANGMKLKELLQKLQKLSPKYDDYEVVGFNDQGFYGSIEDVEIDEKTNEIKIY